MYIGNVSPLPFIAAAAADDDDDDDVDVVFVAVFVVEAGDSCGVGCGT